LITALLIVVSLPWWLAADEAVYQWVQFHRSCSLDGAAQWIDPVVRMTTGALIVVGLVYGGWREPWRILGLGALFLVGAGSVEILKTAIERLRPNSVPMMVSGNSFPSGHTTGIAMAAAISAMLIHGLGVSRSTKRTVYVLAAACVVLQAAGRLLNGSHWLSDVTSSAFLGVSWVLGATWMSRVPKPVAGALVIAGSIVGMVFADLPGWRFHLPSALDERRESVASVEFGSLATLSDLGGKWGDGPREPIGPVSWALSPDVSVRLRGARGQAAVLKITVRPATGADNQRRCARVLVTINGWRAPEIALARGWREYHLEPPAGVLRSDDNTVHFHIISEVPSEGDGPDGALAAFRYVRLYPRA
jgi:membrane-associated phospholipid phosphatase